MKTKKIIQIKITLKELLKKAGISGKLKFFDLGEQNTEKESKELYIEVYQDERK